ncbi:hypothetical protein ES703_17973 [subsurface metagenome]
MIIPKTKLIGVKCSESIYNRVELLANKLEVSNGEILRRALNAYLHKLQEQERQSKGGK